MNLAELYLNLSHCRFRGIERLNLFSSIGDNMFNCL